jgi:hypothetical protein
MRRRGTRERDVHLARKVRRIADLHDAIVQTANERLGPEHLARERARVRARDHVAHGVSARAFRRKTGFRKRRAQGRNIFDRDVMDLEAATGGNVNARMPVPLGQLCDAHELCGRRLAARDANANHENADVPLRAHALRLQAIPILFRNRREATHREAIDIHRDPRRFDVLDPHRALVGG